MKPVQKSNKPPFIFKEKTFSPLELKTKKRI